MQLQWSNKRLEASPPAKLAQSASVYPSAESSNNRLIQGENLAVMNTLLEEFEGNIDLIYADPPFLTGNAYPARAGQGEDSRQPENWRMVEGFADRWNDRSEYLNMLYSRLVVMHRLLSDTGSLYLHLDWHAAAYGKLLLDEVFGTDQLLNEIIWTYHGPSPIRSAFKRKHDTIYLYTKSKAYTFNADAVRVPYEPSTVQTFQSSKKAGFGKQPDLERGKVPEDWWYFPVVARLHRERTGYPTQKPEALLDRIVRASSNPSELVADFFSGAGTAAVVARRLGRRWLACDASPVAINVTRRRLLLEPDAGGFNVWKDRAAEEPTKLRPRLEVTADALTVQARLLDLGASDLNNLTALEMDWDYDGYLFQTASQSIRGWREGSIDPQLEHAYLEPGEYTIAARASDTAGQSGLTTERIRVG